MQLLEFMTGGNQRFGVSELAKSLDLYKSNIHEIVSTFEQLGYVEQDPETKKYSLTMKLLVLGHQIRRRFGFQEILGVRLQKLSDETGELSYFGMLYGHQLIYMGGAFPRTDTIAKPVVGLIRPLYCTSMGKILLAYSGSDVLQAVIGDTLKPFTEKTITNAERLKSELSEIKKRGYSTEHDEYEYGTGGMGVPVTGSDGKLIGALCLSGPSVRFGADKEKEYLPLLNKVASAIAVAGHEGF